MAEPRAEWGKEIVDKLDALTAEFRAFRDMSQKYFTALDVVKWIAGVVAAVFLGLGIGAAFYVNASIATANANVTNQERAAARSEKELADLKAAIANQEREIGKELAKHGREIGKLEGVIETLVKENKKLANLIDKNRPQFANLKAFHGTMLSFKGDKLQFMSPEKVQQEFTVGGETRILVNGKEATIADLLLLKFVPVHVYLIESGQPAILVEVERVKGK